MPIGFQALGEQFESRNPALACLFTPLLPSVLRPSRAAVEPQSLELVSQDVDRQQRLIGLQHLVQMHGLRVTHGVVAPAGCRVEAVIDDLVARTPGAVAAVRARLPAEFPMHVADSILNGLQEAADKLAG